MHRPSPAQICWGTLSVVSATVVLLAVSGADSLLSISVLVIFALVLGTLATTLATTASDAGRAHRNSRAGSRPGIPAGRARLPQRPGQRSAEPASPATGRST